MIKLEPKNPNFRQVIETSFSNQPFMQMMGAKLLRIEPGAVDLELPITEKVKQQHGYVHGGAITALADNAGGFSAITLMPEDTGGLTTDLNMHFAAPGEGDRLIARGKVIKPGRNLILATVEVFAEKNGTEKLAAYMTTTVISITGRANVKG